jgi:predicted regulator of Ras-like GTPase activity (Roadblock/LC7/MglB family)
METLLRQLFEIDGVTGALLFGKDGLPIASVIDDQRGASHAAHAAAVFDLITRYTRQISLGTPRQILIEANMAVLLLAEASDLILCIEAAQSVNLGRLRLEAARVVKDISAQMR